MRTVTRRSTVYECCVKAASAVPACVPGKCVPGKPLLGCRCKRSGWRRYACMAAAFIEDSHWCHGSARQRGQDRNIMPRLSVHEKSSAPFAKLGKQISWARPFLPHRRLDCLYAGGMAHTETDGNVFDGILRELNIEYAVSEADLKHVPL